MLKWYFNLIFCLLYFPILNAEPDLETNYENPNSSAMRAQLANLDSEPSTIVNGCVNIISEDFVDYDVDLVIPAQEPFTIERSHTSSCASMGLFGTGWHSNHQGFIRRHLIEYIDKTTLTSTYGHHGTDGYPQKTV